MVLPKVPPERGGTCEHLETPRSVPLRPGSYTGFRSWLTKIGKSKFFVYPIYQGRPQYIQITNLNMYLLTCNGNGIVFLCNAMRIVSKVKWFFICLQLTFLQKSDWKIWCHDVWFLRLWVSKWHLEVLLARPLHKHFLHYNLEYDHLEKSALVS